MLTAGKSKFNAWMMSFSERPK